MDQLLVIFLNILIFALIVGVVLWALAQLSGYIPQPFYTILRVVIVLIAVLFLVRMLASGGGFFHDVRHEHSLPQISRAV